jgi:hypothetical protein
LEGDRKSLVRLMSVDRGWRDQVRALPAPCARFPHASEQIGPKLFGAIDLGTETKTPARAFALAGALPSLAEYTSKMHLRIKLPANAAATYGKSRTSIDTSAVVRALLPLRGLRCTDWCLRLELDGADVLHQAGRSLVNLQCPPTILCLGVATVSSLVRCSVDTLGLFVLGRDLRVLQLSHLDLSEAARLIDTLAAVPHLEALQLHSCALPARPDAAAYVLPQLAVFSFYGDYDASLEGDKDCLDAILSRATGTLAILCLDGAAIRGDLYSVGSLTALRVVGVGGRWALDAAILRLRLCRSPRICFTDIRGAPGSEDKVVGACATLRRVLDTDDSIWPQLRTVTVPAHPLPPRIFDQTRADRSGRAPFRRSLQLDSKEDARLVSVLTWDFEKLEHLESGYARSCLGVTCWWLG